MSCEKDDRLRFIEFWAEKVKDKKDDSWREEHRNFIDAQVIGANKFYERLILSKNGVAKFKNTTKASDKFVTAFFKFAIKNKSKE